MKPCVSGAASAGVIGCMFGVIEHGVADEFQVARINLHTVAQTAWLKKLFFLACLRRIGMADQTRPKNLSPIGNRPDHGGHLQRRGCNLLADADISRAGSKERDAD